MDTVYRYFAALYASRSVPKYLKECRTVVEKMTGNAYFPTTDPPLAKVAVHLDALEAAEQAAHQGPMGSTANRDVELLVVRGDMRKLRACVQVVADSDITHARAIIESAGMYVSTRAKAVKPPLKARYGSSSGEVVLDAKAIKGQGSYEWQMCTDQAAWTNLAPTATASTSVSGLTPARVYSFRFRAITSAGYTAWSTPVSIIAH